MPIPEHDIDPAPEPETPVEDYLEQQLPALDPDDGQGDEEAVVDAATAPRMPVEADEGDIVEQSLEVPVDEDYPDAES